MYKIFVVEDDATIAKIVKETLQKWDFTVAVAEQFQAIDEEAFAFQPDLILLDISLPFQNGYYWCEKIRQKSEVPIIFISSSSDSMNQVMAMSMGGDDFIAKPFSMDVLIAKIHAILRRVYTYQNNVELIQYKEFTLDVGAMKVFYDDTEIELTKNEFIIFLQLISQSGNIISRDDLMKKLWNTDIFVDDNTLTVNIARLRKKIEVATGKKDVIETKRGQGYYVEK